MYLARGLAAAADVVEVVLPFAHGCVHEKVLLVQGDEPLEQMRDVLRRLDAVLDDERDDVALLLGGEPRLLAHGVAVHVQGSFASTKRPLRESKAANNTYPISDGAMLSRSSVGSNHLG